MANLKLKNPSGGSLALVSADGASDLTVTFPAVTGTAMVSGNMPAFSAYQNSGQAIATLTQTVVVLQVEEFDTNNNFSSNIFTPTVAGYYQFNGAVTFGGITTGGAACSIAKNGTVNKAGQYVNTNSTLGTCASVSALVYLNGTTDYVQLFIFVVTGSTSAIGSANTYFNGSLVRAA